MKRLICTLVFVIPATVSGHALAANASLPVDNPTACQVGPLQQFGRYLGNWTIKDETLSKDGTTWVPGPGALWNFVCLGNGTAIQDFWLPNGGEVGTNLRTYNAEDKSWDIAWAIKPVPGYARIKAKIQDNGSIVMRYVDPVSVPLRRITFHPPNAAGWRWHLDLSSDEGRSWTEVYRITATSSPGDT